MRLEISRNWTMHDNEDNEDFSFYPEALDNRSPLWTLLALYVESSYLLILVLCSKLAGLIPPPPIK